MCACVTNMQVIQMFPDGRTCRTCFLKDSDFDPVIIALKEERQYLRWWKPPTRNGHTQGRNCTYCGRWFCHMVRPSRIPMVTMQEYEGSLGGDISKLQRHVAIVIQSIIGSIEKGAMNFHLNWMPVQESSVSLIKSKRQVFRKKKPFFDHWRLDHYISEWEDLNTNGWLGKGHRFYTLDGVSGVLIASAPITKLELDEEVVAELQENVASSADDGMTQGMMSALHNSMSASLWNETSGGVGAAVDDILAAATTDLTEVHDNKKDQKEDDHTKDDRFSGPEASSVPMKVPSGTQDMHTSRKIAVVKTELRSPATLETPGQPANRQRTPAISANVPNRQKTPCSHVPTSGNQAGKGRKKHDWEAAVAEDLKSFSETLQTDASWWGAGAHTKRKDLEKKRDQVKNRIRNCNDRGEVDDLHKWAKTFSILIELFEASAKHGLLSHDFKVLLDTQDSFRKLDPVVEIDWPSWMVWERHTQDIGSEVDAEKWHRLVATGALVDKGFVKGDKLVKEQARLWNEKFAQILRQESNEVLKRHFPQNVSPEDTEEPTFSFVSAFAVALRADEFELEDRIDLLEDAFEILDEAMPCPARRHPGSPLGSTVTAFKRGMSVVSSARQALAAARTAKSSLDAFAAKMEEFNTSITAVQAQGWLKCSDHDHRELCRHAQEVADVHTGKITALDAEFQSDAVDIFSKRGGEDFVSLVFAACLSLLKPLGEPGLAGMEGLNNWHRHFECRGNTKTKSKSARITQKKNTYSVHRVTRLWTALDA